MSEIRALQSSDIPALAGMFQRVFRDSKMQPSKALSDYLQTFYLDAPGQDIGIHSLVHLDDSGEMTGFVGATGLPVTFDGRPLRAAICGSLMVEGREADPLAGARLLKAFLAGPQDLSFSETASEVSASMWMKLRGLALPQYSLDWLRIIRPAGFFTELGSSRIGAARLLRPLARKTDDILRRRMGADDLRWSGIPASWNGQGSFKTRAVSVDEFAALFVRLTARYRLRPDFPEAQLAYILQDARQARTDGEAVFCQVEARTGAVIGGFVYHGDAGRIGRVLQILSIPGQERQVIDCLIAHAAERGLVALRGRTQPALLEAMLGRRISFTHIASSVIHTKDPQILQAFQNGEGFFNGLAGEHWSRLAAGDIG
ncbi:hypothetical protein [Pararhizobium sp.]|uniref:hypothetical protein n=1 Tax=Pararhizobium sp. TaxID=1977563 RepID=UPI003BAA8510